MAHHRRQSHDEDSAAPQARVYAALMGNIPSTRFLPNNSPAQSSQGNDGALDVDGHRRFPRSNSDLGLWSWTTTTVRSALGYLLVQTKTEPNPQQGCADVNGKTSDGPRVDQHSVPEARYKSDVALIGDVIGIVSTSPLESGATHNQVFTDGATLVALVRNTPPTIPAYVDGGAQTIIGRVYGNLSAGRVGPNAKMNQEFKPSQVTAPTGNPDPQSRNLRDEEGSRRGYSIIPPQPAPSSTPTFAASGQGQTLGQSPKNRYARTNHK